MLWGLPRGTGHSPSRSHMDFLISTAFARRRLPVMRMGSVEGRLHDGGDRADVRLQDAEPAVDEAVGYRCGHEGLSAADVAVEQQAARPSPRTRT